MLKFQESIIMFLQSYQGENELVYIKKQEVLSSLAGRIEEAKGHLKDSSIYLKNLEEKADNARIQIVNKRYDELIHRQVFSNID